VYYYTVDLKKFLLTVQGLSVEDPSFAAVNEQLNYSELNMMFKVKDKILRMELTTIYLYW
jgi:hypothetical protein